MYTSYLIAIQYVYNIQIAHNAIDGLHMTSLATMFDEMCTRAWPSLAESCAQCVLVCTFPLLIIKHVQSIYMYMYMIGSQRILGEIGVLTALANHRS